MRKAALRYAQNKRRMVRMWEQMRHPLVFFP
jgi:hypothetical protein